MDGLIHDVRYALRVLRRRPWAAAIIFATIAIGVGANIAIFSFVNAILLKPLSYPTADRIVALWERSPSGQPNSMSTLNYLDYAASDIFEHVAATAVCCGPTMLSDGASPSPLAGLKVSAPYSRCLAQNRSSAGRSPRARISRPQPGGCLEPSPVGVTIWIGCGRHRPDHSARQRTIHVIGVMP
jgi:hypothetical protein